MPRIPRALPLETVLHVYSRGVDRCDIFHNDGDRRYFLALMAHCFKQGGVALFAYCLMNNHFHLMLAPSSTPLSVTMHRLLLRYALYFNARARRSGHLFQNRFNAKPCYDLSYVLHLTAYIHFNPVRASLVSSPGEWSWSSHQEYHDDRGRYTDLSRLSTIVDMDGGAVRQNYLERAKELANGGPRVDSLDELVSVTAGFIGVSRSDLVSGEKGRAFTKARRLLVQWGLARGYSLTEMAAAINCSRPALSQLQSRVS